MVEIVCCVISSLATIAVAVIGVRSEKEKKKNEKKAVQRAEESRLALKLMAATIELSDVIAIAVSGGHINGNVEAARNKAAQAKRDYYDFLNKVATEAISSQ